MPLRLARSAVLAALALLCMAFPAVACMEGPINVAKGRVFMPDAPHHWTSPVGRMRALHPAYLELGLLGKGDRWELPGADERNQVKWKAEPRAEGGVILWLSAGQGGQDALRLRYIFANGQSSSVLYILIIEPPPPPPGPWTLNVDKAEYKDMARGGRETILRMALPLPDGHRWEVKEAATFGYGGKPPQPLSIEPIPGEVGGFRFVPRGEKARITLVETSDGWLLFPDTVNVELIVDSAIPKC